ncbi:peptidase domain-containing ABC transporter [Pseudomonas sp. 57B-090624]|uniref:peptidase domain-containing ABC transporter n=1 Tax=Pseudomonas sp. 57B-090624 TaxID=2213080 RepID=UPI000DA9BCEC|nr:peptidase domain-containing ABC transporter [Pseudomonas sp. 57B-090624]PZE13342.1 peptidase domain-containing ABC transporter [Pseudomonas sp. 57B-090624]
MAQLRFDSRSKLPIIMQQEKSECGFACIAMIASFYGHEISLREVRAMHRGSSRGATLLEIVQVAMQLGMQARPLKIENNEIDSLKLPALLHWKNSHYVVLRELRAGKFCIHDPASGVVNLSREEFSIFFTGAALELAPGHQFQLKNKIPGVAVRDILGKVHGLHEALVGILASALALEAFSFITPLFTQLVIDKAISSADLDLLLVFGMSFCVLIIFQSFISYLRDWLVCRTGSTLNQSWTGGVFAHLMSLPEDYFQRRSLGDIGSRFGSLKNIQQAITSTITTSFLDGFMSLVTLAAMVIYSPKLATVAFVFTSAYVLVRLALYSKFKSLNIDLISAQARQNSKFYEAVRASQTIKANNLTAQVTTTYLNLVTSYLNRNILASRLTIAFKAFADLIQGIEKIVLLWIGATLVIQQELTAGMLMSISMFSLLFGSKIAHLADNYVELKLLKIHAARISDIVHTEKELHYYPTFFGEIKDKTIEFASVYFRYSPSEPWILENCCFTIKPGEAVAITGSSGIGKSTILKLICGLLEPNSGKILIGGVDVTTIGKEQLRSWMAVILQDDTLFSGTIAENISLFNEQYSIEEISTAAQEACIHGEIIKMPMGYNTLIGDMGSSLSGGQRQRLLIARSLIRTPSFLLFDEATSHLDIENEFRISEILAKRNCTRIIVAHREATIKLCNRILHMEGRRLKDKTNKTITPHLVV